MDPKKALILSLLAASLLHAAEPESPDPETSLQGIRQHRIAQRQARIAVRDSARRQDNLLIGFVPTLDLMNRDPKGGPRIEEDNSCLGISIAYRKHFKSKLGIKAGSQFYAGSTMVSQIQYTAQPDIDYPYDLETSSDGSKGYTYGVNNTVQAILGPIGRFTFEPGLGLTWGGHSADTVILDGDAGRVAYAQERHFAFYDGIIAGSLYFGNKDQFDFSPSFLFGFSPALRNTMKYQISLAFVYAFQLEKQNG